ncbi:MAG: hypothetical protein KC503_43710 [Myxococcales bacterium]|nr:hypothetical protein [Myxococcales bacterium]
MKTRFTYLLCSVALLAGCDGALSGGRIGAPPMSSDTIAAGDAAVAADTTAAADALAGSDGSATTPPAVSSDPLEGLPSGAQQLAALCAKGHADTVAKAFCNAATPPVLSSLADLQKLVGLEIKGANPSSGQNGNPGFATVHHSTALGTRKVNELVPRVIFFTPALGALNQTPLKPNPTYDILAFSRGELFVELASKDTISGEPRFYLLRIHHACETKPGGCTNADLLTHSIESSWTGYSLYDDDAIKNTTVDCLQCHQRGGPGTPKRLLMQEFSLYWNHWFFNESPKQDAVRANFGAAHAGEASYAGLPIATYTGKRLTHPGHLQALLQHNGFGTQANSFDSIQIDKELKTGTKPSWDALYAKTVAGQAMAAPFFDVTPSDPTLVAQMTTAYQAVLTGAKPASTLPDITQTVPQANWPSISVQPAAGLDGRGIMTHICRHCHNSTLDQSISRAGFNVDTLDTLPRAIKDMAIDRLLRPDNDRRKMPPLRFHELTTAQRDLVIKELQK